MMSLASWCCGEPSAVVVRIMSAEPATTVSRLLKSCEMPPISWPRLSSRRRWSSWRLRPRASMWSVVSVTMQTTPLYSPWSSVSGIMLIRTLRCEPSARISRVAPTVDRPAWHSASRRVSSFWPWSSRKPRSETPDQLGAGQAEDDADRLVGVRGHAVGVELQHALGDRLQDPPVPLLAGPQPFHAPAPWNSARRQLAGDVAGQLDLGVGVGGCRASPGSAAGTRRTCCRRSPGTARRVTAADAARVDVRRCRGSGRSRAARRRPGQHDRAAAGGQRGGEVVVG